LEIDVLLWYIFVWKCLKSLMTCAASEILVFFSTMNTSFLSNEQTNVWKNVGRTWRYRVAQVKISHTRAVCPYLERILQSWRMRIPFLFILTAFILSSQCLCRCYGCRHDENGSLYSWTCRKCGTDISCVWMRHTITTLLTNRLT